MKLVRSKRVENHLLDKFRVYLTLSPRTGIHASDLSDPLLSYWKRVKPLPPTKDEILYWLGGQGHHTLLVAAVTGIEDSQEVSLIHPGTGVIFSPDLLKLQGEFKTTRKPSIPQSEEAARRSYAEYIKQCRIYAALLGVNTWKLIVYFMSLEDNSNPHFTQHKPDLRAYELTFSDAELERARRYVEITSEALRAALETQTPDLLPLCTAWKCYTLDEQKRKIGKCPYWEDCKPKGRYDDGTAHAESFDD